MRWTILHESRGRLRLRAEGGALTEARADQLEGWLLRQKGVQRVDIRPRTGSVTVCYRGRRDALVKALAGFSWQQKGLAQLAVRSNRALNQEYRDKLVTKMLTRTARRIFFPAALRWAFTAVRSVPRLWQGLCCLVKREWKVELLDALSIGISMLRRDFSTAGSVMFLLELGELLEEWTHKKSVADLAGQMALHVDKVWLHTPAGEVLVPLAQVGQGDLVVLHTGSIIPLDGRVESGECSVNQASLTGESVPVPKRPGGVLYAGTVVEEGECLLRVTQQKEGSRYDQIVAMIEETQKLRSATEARAVTMADRLVPYTLLGSGLTWLFTRNTARAASVLMVDFSCALKLSIPLAVLSAIREAGSYHCTVKGGKFLETLSKADTVIFDKTGTLTHACPVVRQVVPFGGHDAHEMLRLAACLEEHFPHSIARAVVQAAKEQGLRHEETHSKVEYIVAHGIASAVEGVRVLIGSGHFVFEDQGCVIPDGEQAKFEALPPQDTHLYLCIGGQLAAVLCIADPLRREAPAALEALRQTGVKRLVMLTGDNYHTAQALAYQVGVDDFHAQVLPQDKARFVEEEQKAGRTVVMIGDGINDAPALSAADVGIAIRDGAAIASQVADVTIAANSLFELATLRRLSAALMDRIDRNYRLVLGFNGGLILLGALGVLPPATSALLHNASTLAISLHSMTDLLEEEP